MTRGVSLLLAMVGVLFGLAVFTPGTEGFSFEGVHQQVAELVSLQGGDDTDPPAGQVERNPSSSRQPVPPEAGRPDGVNTSGAEPSKKAERGREKRPSEQPSRAEAQAGIPKQPKVEEILESGKASDTAGNRQGTGQKGRDGYESQHTAEEVHRVNRDTARVFQRIKGHLDNE